MSSSSSEKVQKVDGEQEVEMNSTSSNQGQDNDAISSSDPKVIVDPKDNIQVNDELTVTLLEGDPNRVIYIPYQRQSIKRMIRSAIQNVVAILLVFAFLA